MLISHYGRNVKKMRDNDDFSSVGQFEKRCKSTNVKYSKKHLNFGDTIRYLTVNELKQLFDCIDHYHHKLMFQVIYELGCRVGEFVRMQVKHLNFSRNTVFFPAENTKTQYPRTSYLPKGLMNEIKSLLKQKIVLSKRFENIKKPDAYVFHPGKRWNHRYTENRIRQIFQIYSQKAGLQHSYGDDRKGRELKMFTVHSLRHSHIMHHIVDHGLPLPIVQKQVGHRSLKTTSIYLRPSTEKIAEEYEKVKKQADV